MTNYNELGLCNADPAVDVHLSETGINQANELAEKLQNVSFDIVYISELRRTKQTADAINKFHHARIIVDARPNDNRTGFEGKPVSEYYDALQNADNKWTVQFDDGESLEDTKARVHSFIYKLTTKDYKTVLIVTSMSVVQAFYGIVNGLTNEQAWDFQVDKGACIELDIS